MYFDYFDASSVTSYVSAVQQLNDYIAAEGPFDGVLAFSQGAGLAAMYLVHKTLQQPKEHMPFKVAILLSCVAVYDPVAWLEQGQVRILNPDTDGQLIRIPTAHVWGQEDGLRLEAETIRKLSDEESRAAFVHGGGHEVPGLSTHGAVKGAVQAIRRAVTLAMLRSEIES